MSLGRASSASQNSTLRGDRRIPRLPPNPVKCTFSLDSSSMSDLIPTATLAAWAAPRGVLPYIRQHFLDTTFRGLYHANAFDIALLVPYFIVLILLAGYGMHRYILVYLYYKHRKNRTTEPAAFFEDLPRVTVQLPIFNEQYVAERLLDSICKLKYPWEKLDIQVLDDSTDETVDGAPRLGEPNGEAGSPLT